MGAIRSPVIIAVGGLDPSGGAGLAADILAASSLGVHVAPVTAVLTVQDTGGSVYARPVEPWVLGSQLERVMSDFGARVIKTGVLGSVSNLLVVAEAVRSSGAVLVVDTVWETGSGDPLVEDVEAYVAALRSRLIPLAEVVTLNAAEASKITGINAGSRVEAMRAARFVVERLGARMAIVKGGHVEPWGSVVYDAVYDADRGEFLLEHPRLSPCGERGLHGTGCTFAASIAAGLALGLSRVEAARLAESIVYEAIRFAKNIGRGRCPVSPLAYVYRRASLLDAMASVRRAAEYLVENADVLLGYVPEVGINIAEIIPGADSAEDAAGIEGRVVRADQRLVMAGCPWPGGSSHMARLAIAAHRLDSSIRAAGNLVYREELVRAARVLGLSVFRARREEEPSSEEGSTMQWLVRRAYEELGMVPRVIYDTGAPGKEAMVRVLGSSALEVAGLMVRLALVAGRATRNTDKD